MKFLTISPLIYGVMISGTYSLFKHLGVNGGLNYFFINCSLLTIFIFLLRPKSSLNVFKNKTEVARSVAFGMTQCLIFLGLNYGFVGDVTLISFSGVLVCNAFYRLLKGEYSYLIWILVPSLLLAFYIGGTNPVAAYFSLAAGILSGGTMLLTRSSQKEEVPLIRVLFGNFFFGALFSAVGLMMAGGYEFEGDIMTYSVGVTTAVVLALQAFYYLLFKGLPAAVVGTLLLIRIPAAYLFDFLLFEHIYSVKEWLIAFTLIIIAILITTPRAFLAPIKLARYR